MFWLTFSTCAPWFTKDQEGHKIYWASGNNVLDIYSTIQYMTICCLCHANIIMLSAIRLELSILRVAPSQVTKMSLRTPDPFYTHTWKFEHETTPKCVMVCIRTVSSISIWNTLACLLTVKHCLSCSSLLQNPQVSRLCSHLGYSVCQIAESLGKRVHFVIVTHKNMRNPV